MTWKKLKKLSSIKKFKAEQMKNPAFAAYEEVEPAMNIIRAIVDTRIAHHLTQRELAEKTGIAQTEISRIENGSQSFFKNFTAPGRRYGHGFKNIIRTQKESPSITVICVLTCIEKLTKLLTKLRTKLKTLTKLERICL